MNFLKSKLFYTFIAIVVVVGGFYIAKDYILEENFPYIYTYITNEDNQLKEQQINLIEKTLKDNNKKYEKIQFEMLNVDNSNTVVIRKTEYNVLAKKLNSNEANLKENETMIIPRYDGMINTEYRKELEEVEKFKLGAIELKVVDVGSKKILVTGLFENQLVISDEVYEKMKKESTNKIINIYGYNFDNLGGSGEMTRKLKMDDLFADMYERTKEYYLLLE